MSRFHSIDEALRYIFRLEDISYAQTAEIDDGLAREAMLNVKLELALTDSQFLMSELLKLKAETASALTATAHNLDAAVILLSGFIGESQLPLPALKQAATEFVQAHIASNKPNDET